jgi:hypothetical protein
MVNTPTATLALNLVIDRHIPEGTYVSRVVAHVLNLNHRNRKASNGCLTIRRTSFKFGCRINTTVEVFPGKPAKSNLKSAYHLDCRKTGK